MGERPFNAMGGFMRLTETMDAIPAGVLADLVHFGSLLVELKHLQGEFEARELAAKVIAKL